MLLYTRLDRHLQARAEGAGPVSGSLTAPRVGMIWLAANLVVTTLLTGTLFVPGVGFGTAFLMIVLGTVGGAVVLTAVGSMGARTGLPTMALTRGGFGTRGSVLPLAANVVILMGWSWVQAMLAGVTVDAVVEDLTGFSNPILFSVLCQALVVALAIFGHEGIARLEPWFAVLILAVTAWIFTTAFTTFDVGDFLAVEPDPSLGLGPIAVVDVVIATAVSWTVLSADLTRYARTPRAGAIGASVGYTLSTVIAMTLGLTAFVHVILATGTVPDAFDPGVLVDQFGVPIAVVVFLSVMATNTMVVYGMVTSVVNARVGSRLRFLPTALVLGGVSIVGASWLALLGQFTDFLVTISALFVPVFAIMVVDYHVIKRRSYGADIMAARGGRYWYAGGVNPVAVVVWVVGALMSYVWAYVWASPIGATVPAFVLSAGLYLIAMLPERRRTTSEPSAHLAEQPEREPSLDPT